MDTSIYVPRLRSPHRDTALTPSAVGTGGDADTSLTVASTVTATSSQPSVSYDAPTAGGSDVDAETASAFATVLVPDRAMSAIAPVGPDSDSDGDTGGAMGSGPVELEGRYTTL